MWRYVAIPENKKKSVIFCIFLVVALWRYVAICGDTPKIKKTVFFEVFFPKAVALWRYVAIPENKKIRFFCAFFGCGTVAICGDVWRYPKN